MTGQYSHWEKPELRSVAVKAAPRSKRSRSDVKVLEHVDKCNASGHAAGLGGYSRKLMQNAVRKLTTSGELVYVGHATKGKGWIRATLLEQWKLNGWREEVPAV